MAPKDDTYDMLDTSPEKGGRGKIIGLIVLLLVIAGGVSAYFLMKGKSSEDTANNNNAAAKESVTSKASPAPSQPSTAPTNSSAAAPGAGSAMSSDNSQSSTPASKPGGSTEGSTGSAELKEVVHFASNSTGVLQADAAKLKTFLSKVEGKKGVVTIEGHADSQGTDGHNQQLSAARAEQVASQLQRSGLNKQFKVNVRGLSSKQPVTDNDSLEGRAQNRRVEMSFASQK